MHSLFLLEINMRCATPSALAAWFVSKRKALGLTQAQVASSANVTQKTLSDFERGKTNIRLETLFRLLAIVKLNLELVDKPTQKEMDALPW